VGGSVSMDCTRSLYVLAVGWGMSRMTVVGLESVMGYGVESRRPWASWALYDRVSLCAATS
jgi:hypothetical protein